MFDTGKVYWLMVAVAESVHDITNALINQLVSPLALMNSSKLSIFSQEPH